jgi:hypothetical protein
VAPVTGGLGEFLAAGWTFEGPGAVDAEGELDATVEAEANPAFGAVPTHPLNTLPAGSTRLGETGVRHALTPPSFDRRLSKNPRRDGHPRSTESNGNGEGKNTWKASIPNASIHFS